jgi:hypothetical protein
MCERVFLAGSPEFPREDDHCNRSKENHHRPVQDDQKRRCRMEDPSAEVLQEFECRGSVGS